MNKTLIIAIITMLLAAACVVSAQSRRNATQPGEAHFDELYYVVCTCGNRIAHYDYDGNQHNIYRCDKCKLAWANKVGTSDLVLVNGTKKQPKEDHPFDRTCFTATFSNGVLTVTRTPKCNEALYIPVAVWACRYVKDRDNNYVLRRSHKKEEITLVLSANSTSITKTLSPTDSVFILTKSCCHRRSGRDNGLSGKKASQ